MKVLDQVTERHVARQDPAVGLMDLCRPVKRGEAPPRLDVTQEHDAWRVRILAPYMLRALDQSVLLALLYLAGVSRDEDGEHAALRRQLRPKEGAKGAPTIVVSTTMYRLAQLVFPRGRSGDRYDAIRESLTRLSAISIRVEEIGQEKRWGQSNLIAEGAGDDERLAVAVNWRLAETVIGGAGVQAVAISVDERMALSEAGDVAQIAHAWLSAWLRPGAAGEIGIETLARHVWGSDAEGALQRVRRGRIRKALSAIAVVGGWNVTIRGAGARQVAALRRPELVPQRSRRIVPERLRASAVTVTR